MDKSIKLVRAFKYRIYPNVSQTAQLERVLDVACHVYNDIVHTAQLEYQAGDKWNWMQAAKNWREQRNQNAIIGELLPSDTVNDLVRRYDYNLKSFWALRENGHEDAMPPGEVPRAKFKSVGYRPGSGVKFITDGTDVARLRLWTVPGLIRVHYHRPIPDGWRVKHFVITKAKNAQWYVVLQIECKDAVIAPSDKPAVGIDVGMYSLLALSDGHMEPNPRWYRQGMKQRRVLGRKAARQLRASNPDNYHPDGTPKEGARFWHKSNKLRETERLIRKLDGKIQRQRQHYWHTVTDALTKKYGLIAIEDLTLDFMIENKRLAMSVHDAAFATFWQMLEYKCKARGVTLVKVNPAYTSQLCSGCGELVQKTLKERVHRCGSCGLEIDRDVNAARVILQLALNGPYRGRHDVTQADGPNVS